MSLSSVAHSYNGFLAPPLVNRTESALAAPPSIPANKALSFRNESDHPEPKILTFTYTPNGDELSTSGDLQMPSYVDLFLKIEVGSPFLLLWLVLIDCAVARIPEPRTQSG